MNPELIKIIAEFVRQNVNKKGLVDPTKQASDDLDDAICSALGKSGPDFRQGPIFRDDRIKWVVAMPEIVTTALIEFISDNVRSIQSMDGGTTQIQFQCQNPTKCSENPWGDRVFMAMRWR